MKSKTARTTRPRLSVALVVRNAEEILADSIESVRAIADEMLVLDTGSTDKTGAVAWRLGATLANMPWRHDFAAARNRCLELLTGQWVLWLNAGERLTADSAAALRAFVDQSADSAKVYHLPVELSATGGAIGGEEACQPRLMPRCAGLRFSGRVRENLRMAMERNHMTFDAAPGRILRHPDHHRQAWKALRADRNLTLAALELSEQAAPDPRLLLVEGEAYCHLGMFDQARHAFLSARDSAPRASLEMLEAYYGLLTCYACDPFLSHHQLNVCVEALDVFPVDTQLLLMLGNYLYAGNRIDTAIRAFDTAVRFGQVHHEVWHLCEIEKVAEMCLNAALGLREAGKAAAPTPEAPLAETPGRTLRIDQRDKPEEAGSIHLPLPSEVLSNHAFF